MLASSMFTEAKMMDKKSTSLPQTGWQNEQDLMSS